MDPKPFDKNRIPRQVLLQVILCLGLTVAAYVVVLANPIRGSADNQRSANSTKTALARTAAALLGPFPTATVPTATASDLPTVTSTLPSATPTVTRTLTSTPTLFQSPTPRAREADSDAASTLVPPTPRPASTRTSAPASQPPATEPPNEPPAPTDPPVEPQPTDPPVGIPPIEIPPIIRTLLP